MRFCMFNCSWLLFFAERFDNNKKYSHYGAFICIFCCYCRPIYVVKWMMNTEFFVFHFVKNFCACYTWSSGGSFYPGYINLFSRIKTKFWKGVTELACALTCNGATLQFFFPVSLVEGLIRTGRLGPPSDYADRLIGSEFLFYLPIILND
jgi:hypothetical protein